MISAFKSKKGVSPLIATILLIAFAVALSSVVLKWGSTLSIGRSQDRCRDVEIKIRNIETAEVCFGGVGQKGYINFIIDNTGQLDINGLVVWIIGDKGTKTVDLDKALIKKNSLFDKKDKEVSYDFSTFGNIQQVQFIPKIKTGSISDICSKSSVKAEKIGVCS